MTAPDISLPRFEGPLDLLLELVRSHGVEITDIPIAEVTRQYLDYLREAEDRYIELGPDFAYIASLLIHIKSRRLLAADPELAEREEDDPGQELVRLLLDHGKVRSAASFLKERLEIAEAMLSNPSIDEFRSAPGFDLIPPGSLNLLQVLRLAQQALDTARIFDLVHPAAPPVTVEEMMRWLAERLAGAGRTAFEPLLAEQPDPQRKIALFLALLELAKAARIEVDQEAVFGPVFIDTKPRLPSFGTTVP